MPSFNKTSLSAITLLQKIADLIDNAEKSDDKIDSISNYSFNGGIYKIRVRLANFPESVVVEIIRREPGA